MKKLLSLVLALAMIFALCACGSGSSSGSTSAASATATPAPEFEYKSEYVPLMSGKTAGITPYYYTEDGVYCSGSETIGTTADPDVVPEYVGQFDITETRLYFVDYSGNIRTLSDYEQPTSGIEANEDGEFYLADGTRIYNFEEYSYISGLALTSDGHLLALETLYEFWDDIEVNDWSDSDYDDHHFYESHFYLRELDENGAGISNIEFGSGDSNIWYTSTGHVDSDNNLIITCDDYSDNATSEFTLQGMDPATGEIKWSIPCDNYIESTFQAQDGTFYAVMWGDSGVACYPVDFDAQKLGEAEFSVPTDAYYFYPGGDDYAVYYTSGTKLYGINSAGESEVVFDWLDSNVNPDQISTVYIGTDGVIHAIINNYDSTSQAFDVDLVTVTKQPYDASKQVTVITVGAQYSDYSLREAVIDFNRSHDDVRVEIIDYSQYNTEDDYSAGITKMNTEIIAGSGPDVIALDGLNTTQLAARGLLEDLYPYVESDSEIDINDYFPAVISAAEHEGKLVQSVSAFYMHVVAGATSIVGEGPAWTYDEFNSALSEMPDGASAFDTTVTRSDILRECLALDMNNFVSWDTGAVDFDNESFTNLLEFANSFPESVNFDDYNYQTDSADVRISEGMQMLYPSQIYSVNELMYIESCFSGRDVTLIGYPTLSGCGNMIQLVPGYAISASCSNKEAAWEFVRTFFTEEYYRSYGDGLPAIKSIYEEDLADAETVRYKLDTLGHYILDENGEKIPNERYYAIGSSIYSYYALSENLGDQFTSLINSELAVYNYDTDIISIVEEQAEAYFSGQKSAQEVAKLVQSKANIYVNEQR